MAQDAVRVSRPPLGPQRALAFVAAVRRIRVMPPAPALGPVIYAKPLVTYVFALALAAAVVAVATVRSPSDVTTLTVAGVTILLMARFAVRSLAVQTTWSPSVFLHIGLSVVLGPPGAVTAAFAEAAGLGLGTRNGWFRSLFNFSNIFLADISAWAVFTAVQHVSPSVGWDVLAGLAAGIAEFFVNHSLVLLVLRVANPKVSILALVRHHLADLPYSIGYGIAAFTFLLMHRTAGALGFSGLIVPVILLQGFLIVFARRVHAYEEQRAAHQKEREALLQKAVEASESERRRIARDLHDGVVQNLAGMAFSLSATATRLRERAKENGNKELLEVLEESAEETRLAMKDLRTLIIEIAPPTLRREGLHAALLEVLRTLKAKGTETSLELPDNMRLRPDRANLIFRVAQEVLRNVASHAEARHVSVVLQQNGREAKLQIVDDGKGFSAEDVARRRAEGHVGTNAIVELAEEVGGSLEIDSAPRRGTRVTLVVPTE